MLRDRQQCDPNALVYAQWAVTISAAGMLIRTRRDRLLAGEVRDRHKAL